MIRNPRSNKISPAPVFSGCVASGNRLGRCFTVPMNNNVPGVCGVGKGCCSRCRSMVLVGDGRTSTSTARGTVLSRLRCINRATANCAIRGVCVTKSYTAALSVDNREVCGAGCNCCHPLRGCAIIGGRCCLNDCLGRLA